MPLQARAPLLPSAGGPNFSSGHRARATQGPGRGLERWLSRRGEFCSSVQLLVGDVLERGIARPRGRERREALLQAHGQEGGQRAKKVKMT